MQDFGHIISCRLQCDAAGQSQGFGFVQFEQPEQALAAIEKLDGSDFHGKPLQVMLHKRKNERAI